MTTRKRRRPIKDKTVLLGVTGSVAAYKAVEIARRLKDEGALVKVVMTDASCRFITPLSLSLAAGEEALVGMFDKPLAHIELPAEADLMLIAPATANIIGKLASGEVDDLLCGCFMAYQGKTLIAPAMNHRMYGSPVLQRNLDYLKSIGVQEIIPGDGALACGEEGKGRMAEVHEVLEAVRSALTPKDLKSKKILISAGPTREHIDSVRFISNRSTGKQGYALAKVAARRGADVTLISGPTALSAPSGVKYIGVKSAADMKSAVMSAINQVDVLIMSAAVADLSPKQKSDTKLSKDRMGQIEFERTDDILAEVGAMKTRPLVIGFAAEAQNNIKRAKEKLVKKNSDFIVFNNIDDPEAGFEVDTNKVTIIGKDFAEEYPVMSKEEVADAVLDRTLGACRGG